MGSLSVGKEVHFDLARHRKRSGEMEGGGAERLLPPGAGVKQEPPSPEPWSADDAAEAFIPVSSPVRRVARRMVGVEHDDVRLCCAGGPRHPLGCTHDAPGIRRRQH